MGKFNPSILFLNSQPDSVFVITAYDLRGEPLIAYKRRHRRKGNEINKIPSRLGRKCVHEVLAHYESRTGEEAVAENEAAFEAAGKRSW